MAQADELGRVLRLVAGDHLLNVGAGCGWPGLYLAERHGCEVTSVDPVMEGMVTSRSRARRDGLADRHGAVAAPGEQLPFRAGSFDAVIHTDVVC
jgi:cyclopropane-fatty-acyl-phospholipid synthase